jgi:uncharacterized damage-inducible protein DinB
MNADGCRLLYEYHFAANHKIWDTCIFPLSDEQYTADDAYSHGSVRNQLVHLMSVEARWFAGLRGVAVPDHANPSDYLDRATLRAAWDTVEAHMRVYLAAVTDADLAQPYPGAEVLQKWEVLFHVLNHATDHRAQLLALLDRMGAATFPQDYALYRFGRM